LPDNATSPTDRTPRTILVVDDEEAGRFVKLQILRRAGFDVMEASTGREALEIVRRESPDLVILDVHLPDMSGFEVASTLKRETGSPALQILQVSSTSITSADRVKALSSGADAYLAEPIEADVMLATVKGLLRVRHAETRLAAALERERAAREEAEKANRLKDEFLAGLSHELRTPMNAIMGWIWQLRHSTLSEQGRERALASLERNTKLQTQLINDLLDVSRISRGKMQLSMMVVDVESVVEAAADSLRQSAANKMVELHVLTEPAVVCGDPVRLQQVITNLLNNAVHFTQAGGRIDLTMETQGSMLGVQVRDTGSGIAEDFLPFVFDKFRQADSGMARQHGGLGVGLAIVKDIAELHGGTVSVLSAGVGRGATFLVCLPLADQPTIDLQRRVGERPILTGLRVLVVDEDEDNRANLTMALEASGATVRGVPSRDAAVSAAASTKFDVVFGEQLPDVPNVPTFNGPGNEVTDANGGEREAAPIKPGTLISTIARTLTAANA
jgi:two-component system, sensor histidine kinase